MNEIKLLLKSLITAQDPKESVANIIDSEKDYVSRVLNTQLNLKQYKFLKSNIKYVGVTNNFREVIDYFKVPATETPAGFKTQFLLDPVL